MISFYEVLGVFPRATLAEIKAAYRRLALETHPDKKTSTIDDLNHAVASIHDEGRFKSIQTAWQVRMTHWHQQVAQQGDRGMLENAN